MNESDEKEKRKSPFNFTSFGFAEAKKPVNFKGNHTAASNNSALIGSGTITGKTIAESKGKGSKSRSIVFIHSN